MKEMEEGVGWEQERRAAKRVLECLEHDSKQQNVKRRWILRNWPEPSGRGGKNLHPSLVECLPELLLREKGEPSLKSLNALVGKSLSTLLKTKILRKRTSKKRKSGDGLMRLTLDPAAGKEGPLKITIGGSQSGGRSMVANEGLLRITDSASQSVAIRNDPARVEESLLRITDGASDSDAPVKKVYHSSQKWRPPKRFYNLKKMDEAEIVTLLPCVLEALHIHALQSILSVLTGFTTRILNRNWLEERIVQTVNDYVNECGDTLPDVVMQAIEIIRDQKSTRKPMSSGMLFALPPSSILAIQSALDQVETLPLRTLHAMYDMIHEKPVEKVRLVQSVTGGNRERLARSLRATAEKLTADLEDGYPLPEPLKKALHAMCLSAKELDGNDGNLLSIIGRPPPDVEAVHDKVLVALSRLKKLEFHSLSSLSSLVHEGPVQSFCKEHPTYLRSHFRRILLDFLLRCDDSEVPAPIQDIIDLIAAEDVHSPEKSKKYQKKPKKPDRLSKRSMWQQGERNSDEVEAVLQISSHLEQVVREKEEAEGTVATVPVKVEDEFVLRDEDDGDLPEDVAVRTAADEAGTLCYAILGRALEELLPQKVSALPHYVQKYLQGGFHRVPKQGRAVGGYEGSPVDEVDLLMKIAESLPGVSTRALQNMKSRLGLI
ncbi:hypothetical protein M758_6G072400 [Ceratodon purpureus]|nr:hypothetical protein M758_6G072400 [Ceratodon purpureus]